MKFWEDSFMVNTWSELEVNTNSINLSSATNQKFFEYPLKVYEHSRHHLLLPIARHPRPQQRLPSTPWLPIKDLLHAEDYTRHWEHSKEQNKVPAFMKFTHYRASETVQNQTHNSININSGPDLHRSVKQDTGRADGAGLSGKTSLRSSHNISSPESQSNRDGTTRKKDSMKGT